MLMHTKHGEGEEYMEGRTVQTEQGAWCADKVETKLPDRAINLFCKSGLPAVCVASHH